MIFIGDDWSEGHHDIEIQDDNGQMLERCRLDEDVDGLAKFHELIAIHSMEPSGVLVAIETDRGLWVAALVAAGVSGVRVEPEDRGALPRALLDFGGEIGPR